jgi:hypothetical protein
MAGPLLATVVEDQEQIAWQTIARVDVGGHLRQQVAQTYTAGVTGTLQRAHLLVGCEDSTVGSFHVDIQTVNLSGQPSGTVLGTASEEAATLVPGEGQAYIFWSFLPPDVPQVDGTSYAIAMRADEGASCFTAPGPAAGSMFAYPFGDAYVADTSGGGVVWSQVTEPYVDYVFYTYVYLPDSPDEPAFCKFKDVAGVPNDWLPADVPACGCLVDPVFNAHRCWFGLPDFVLWREIIPFGEPGAVAEWTVVPLNSGIDEVVVQEYSESAQGLEVSFSKDLKPGKPRSQKTNAVDLVKPPRFQSFSSGRAAMPKYALKCFRTYPHRPGGMKARGKQV